MSERIPYFDDLEWNDDGERVCHGTCRPIKDHQVELSGWWEGQYQTKIICPDAEYGGCVITNGHNRQECWMIPWMDNIGPELIDGSQVTIRMQIRDTSHIHLLADEDGYTIAFTGVAAVGAALGVEEGDDE